MKSKRAIIVFVSLIVLIASSLVLSIRNSIATTRPVQGTVIGQCPVGGIRSKYVLRTKGGTVGYLTYIAGYDGPYFSDPTKQDETTAYFTLKSTPVVASTGFFRVGYIASYRDQPRGSDATIYFNATPHGNYEDLNTFSDGIKIAESQSESAQTIFKRETGGATGFTFFQAYSTSISTFSGSFTLGDKTYTYSAVGDRYAGYYLAAPNDVDPTIYNIIGYNSALP
jgi:hypothetical protein